MNYTLYLHPGIDLRQFGIFDSSTPGTPFLNTYPKPPLPHTPICYRKMSPHALYSFEFLSVGSRNGQNSEASIGINIVLKLGTEEPPLNMWVFDNQCLPLRAFGMCPLHREDTQYIYRQCIPPVIGPLIGLWAPKSKGAFQLEKN